MATRKRTHKASVPVEVTPRTASDPPPKRQIASRTPVHSLCLTPLVMPPGFYSETTLNADGEVILVQAHKHGNPAAKVNIFCSFHAPGKIDEEATWDEATAKGHFRKYGADGVLRNAYDFVGLEGDRTAVGPDRLYSPTGELVAWTHYNLQGKKHGAQLFYLDGVLLAQATYMNGYEHGTRRRWDTRGNLELEEVYCLGQLFGPRRTRNSDGTYSLVDHCGQHTVVGLSGTPGWYEFSSYNEHAGVLPDKNKLA